MKNEELIEINKCLSRGDYASLEKIIYRLNEEEEKTDFNYWFAKVLLARYKKDDEMFISSVIGGMRVCPTDYNIYYYLGEHYLQSNKDKAYLCFEMAEFYCHDEQKNVIQSMKKKLLDSGDINVKPVSIVIPSYNCMKMMQNCISSIRQTNCKGSYEIVVVDNASTDGIREWLLEQEDIVLVANDENVGFPVACNQGIAASKPENDIFLLNNDTIVPANAIFWLRMGLYENHNVGATGSVSNCVANDQMIIEEFSTTQEYIDWAYTNNILSTNPYEKRLYLIGFALMLKRTVLNEVGLLDEAFSPGNFEDNDIGFRINAAGYRVLLCRNSFIFHYGSQSFNKDEKKFKELIERNKKYFKSKWGAEFEYYSMAREEILNAIKEKKYAKFNLLEVGCGVGATLSKLQYGYPNATVHGIELNESVAKVGGYYLDIVQGNIETMELDYDEESFDYIIFGDVLEHLSDPLAVVKKVKRYLKPGGRIIATIPNLLNASVILPLLMGRFEYSDSGLLDKTHCHLFTKYEAAKMFAEAGYVIERVSDINVDMVMAESVKPIYAALLNIPNIVDESEFKAYQYLFVVVKS